MWSLYENEKQLEPLIFSSGKSQKDIVLEVLEAIKEGYKTIFIKGVCGSGKSAIALNLARKLGKTSIVVPVKSLQEQYSKDYSGKKYILNKNKKLKICSIVGRKNFECKFLKENKKSLNLEPQRTKERDTKLTDIFQGKTIEKNSESKSDDSCDNKYLPCKIEIKEKNIFVIKDFINQNPDVKITNFNSINEVKRMTIAPVCPYWSPILPEEFEIKKFKDARKSYYQGLNNKSFIIYQRKPGCPYYDQYQAYADADVILFNSLKYKIEVLMDRKPFTELEIIDECDEFLDSFANKEQINLNKLLFSLSFVFSSNSKSQKTINKLTDIINTIKKKYEESEEPVKIKNTLIEEFLLTILENKEFLEEIEIDESNYLYHLDKVSRLFYDFLDETFFSIEKRETDIIINLITTNLKKRFKELSEKNKIIVMMSGTIHSESVLKNIFGLDKFKIIEAETKLQGNLVKCKHGYEIDCKYSNFQSKKISRKQYLLALSKSVSCAKPPTLIHLTSFSDLPTENEKEEFNINNLPTRQEIIYQQTQDPLGKRIRDFKNKKTKILFTTKCSRGVDFPGDICNSIILTRFPYPNISSLFWKILKKTNPNHFMSFYIDKAKRELLQKVYRGLRSETDKVYLLSPDIRVLDCSI